MRTFLAAVMLLAGVLVTFADQDRVFQLKESPREIRIDGVIEPNWSTADSVVNFFQLEPYYGQPPTSICES